MGRNNNITQIYPPLGIRRLFQHNRCKADPYWLSVKGVTIVAQRVSAFGCSGRRLNYEPQTGRASMTISPEGSVIDSLLQRPHVLKS